MNKVSKVSKADKKVTIGFLARLCFARYYVWDNYGTRELCFTLNEAKEWLKFCGTVAVIGDRLKKKVIASRVYTASQGF